MRPVNFKNLQINKISSKTKFNFSSQSKYRMGIYNFGKIHGLKFMVLCSISDFLGLLKRKMGVEGSWASKPNRKVGLLSGPFGSTDISKSYFQNFNPPPPLDE